MDKEQLSQDVQDLVSATGAVMPAPPKPLSDLADMCQSGLDITEHVPESTVDNMKAFLVIYARSQLQRVIKLTDALQTLEDSMIEDATKNTHKYSPDQMIRMFTTIQSSLNSAISLIKQVSSDESYYNVIINNNKTTINTINQVTNMSAVELKSQDSREKVRQVAAQLLKGLQ